MRILIRILILVAALTGVLAVIVALQPAEFTIERSMTVAAPAALVAPHIENLEAFDAWQPFARMDPQMVITYSGPPSGVGASASWVAPQMGKGRMTITKVDPDREIDMKLEFFEPMAGTNQVVFSLTPEGDGTRVEWRMQGRNGFVGKAMSLLAGMEKRMNTTFDGGLATLRQKVEVEAAQRAARDADAARAAADAARAAEQGVVPPQGDEIPVQ